MGGHVSIGDHAVIGGQSALHQFIRIGRGAMVSGVSGVASDVIPFGHIVGHRAALSGLNVVGLRRRGFDRARILMLRACFKSLFLAGGTFTERQAAVRAEHGSDPIVAEILDFIAKPSKRGLLHAHATEDASLHGELAGAE